MTDSRNGSSAVRGPIKSYRDIEAFQRCMAVMVPIHALIRRLPREERWELASQMRRATKSVALNIAEGYGKKRSTANFRTFLDNAVGSANEVIGQLEIALAVGYATKQEVRPLIDEYEVIARQLYRLAENWRERRE